MSGPIRRLLHASFLLLVLSSLLLLAPSGSADRGVGVSTGEMTVETQLEPGRGYVLPSITVINTGDETSAYAVSISYLEGRTEQRPDRDWFNFQPERFVLEPGASTEFVARIVVPTDAHSGDYFALIKAQTVSETGGNTSLGVAAATKLAFEVRPSSWLTAQVQAANRWLDDASPWTYLVPASLLLGFLAFKVRRLPFRIRFERR